MAQQDDAIVGAGDDEEMDLSNKDLLRILMQEISDVRYELQQDMSEMRQEILGEMNGKFEGVHRKIDTLASEMKTLRMEVHQNQVSFMKNQEDLEGRVIVLEAQAA